MDQSEELNRKQTGLTLDKDLFIQFTEQCALSVLLSGPMNKIKVKSQTHEEIDFEVSDGWFWQWQKQHVVIGQSIIK